MPLILLETRANTQVSGRKRTTWEGAVTMVLLAEERAALLATPFTAEMTAGDSDKSFYAVVGQVPACAIWNLLSN